MKRKARTLMYLGLGLCGAIVVNATVAAQSQNWTLWAVNAAIFLIAGGCVVVCAVVLNRTTT